MEKERAASVQLLTLFYKYDYFYQTSNTSEADILENEK